MNVAPVVEVLLAVCLALLGTAALLALVRVEKGPSMLDRAITLDVVTVIVLGSVALMTARTGRTDLVPVLAVLAVVGFVGSVALGRFAAAEAPDEARILSPEELAALDAATPVDDAEPPVHDRDTEDQDDDADQPRERS